MTNQNRNSVIIIIIIIIIYFILFFSIFDCLAQGVECCLFFPTRPLVVGESKTVALFNRVAVLKYSTQSHLSF